MNSLSGTSQMIACLLILGALNGWSSSVTRSASSGIQEETGGNAGVGRGSSRNDIVDVEVPSRALKLAEESDIRLQLRARGLTSVRISQSQHGINTSFYFDVPESYSTAP